MLSLQETAMRDGSLKSPKSTLSKKQKKIRPTPLQEAGLTETSSSSSSVIVSPNTKTSQNNLRARSTLKPQSFSFLNMISPRSSNYELLEGGHGHSRNNKPSMGGNGKMFTWKRVAIGAAALITLVFFFGPRRTKITDPTSGDYHDDDHYDEHDDWHHTDTAPAATHPTTGTHPTSFETDPHPSLTTHCTKPHSSTSPIVQWALMIDAGSTGSRIHIYKFHNCLSTPSFEYEVFKQIQPGLSSFAGNPEKAARSLDPLLEEAVKTVPKSMQGCTPVAVKATAGLRLLPGKQSHDILTAVERRLKTVYKFQLSDKPGEAVQVMDGKDEGVYAWITANYLLGTIGTSESLKKQKPTYAVLDLGGASTQIVFEPSFSPSSATPSSEDATHSSHLEDGEHKYTLTFMGHTHILYQHSYLGYGLMRARKSVHTLVEFMSRMRVRPEHDKPVLDENGHEVIANPCISINTNRTVEVELDPQNEKDHLKRNVTMAGETIGSFDACSQVVQLVLAKNAICTLKPCSFNGVYQPSLLDSFPDDRGKVLLLSYFYDRVWPLVYPEGVSEERARNLQPSLFNSGSTQPKLTLTTIRSLASEVCIGPSAWRKHTLWKLSPKLQAELDDRPEWCLDLTFMYGLLRMGYEFGEERTVRVEKQVEGTELGWCLGAAIGLVGDGGFSLKCTDNENGHEHEHTDVVDIEEDD